MAPRLITLLFHLGLLPSALLLARGDVEAMRHLLPLGLTHMVLLFAAGCRVRPPGTAAVVQTLHKAGFLHTLLGLGAAILAVARASTDLATGPVSIMTALAPMGTAILPHALGVWLGHAIDMRRGPDEMTEDAMQKLAREADASLKVLETAHARLDGLTPGLERLGGRLTDMLAKCTEASKRVEAALVELERRSAGAADAAENFEGSIARVADVNNQIAVVHRQLIELLESTLAADAPTGGRR